MPSTTTVIIHPSTEKHQPATSTPMARPSKYPDTRPPPPKPRKADHQLEAERKPEIVPRKEPTLDEASKSGRPRPPPPRPRQLDQPSREKLSAKTTEVDGDETGAKLPNQEQARRETVPSSERSPKEDEVKARPPRPVPVPPGDRPRPPPPRPRQPNEEAEKPTAKEETTSDITKESAPRPVPVPPPPGDRPRPPPPRPRQPNREAEKPTTKEETIAKESIETPSEDVASNASEKPPKPVPVPQGDRPRPPPPRPRQPNEEPTAKEETIAKESIETPSEDVASNASEKPPRPVPVPPGDRPRPPPPRPRQPNEEPTAKEETIAKESEKPPRSVPVPQGDRPRRPPPRPRQPNEEAEKPTAKEETIAKKSIETPSEDVASNASEKPPRPVPVPPGDRPRPPPPRPRQPNEEQPSLEKPAEVENETTSKEAKHESKEEGHLVTLQTSEQPSSPKAEHKHPKRPAHRPTRPPSIIRRQQPPQEVSVAGEIPSEAVHKEKPTNELQSAEEVPTKQEPLPNKEDAGHEHPPSDSEVKTKPPRPVSIPDSPPAERRHHKKPTHRPARPPSIIKVKTGSDIEPERSIPQEPLAPSTQDLQKADNESLPINEQISTTPAEPKQKPPRPAVATPPSSTKPTRPTQRPSRPPSIVRRQHSAQDHQLEHKTLPVVEAIDEKEKVSVKIEKAVEETKGDISPVLTHEPAAATEGPPKPKHPRSVAKAPLRHSQSLGQKPARPPSIIREQHHAAPGLEDESVIKTSQESESAKQKTPPTERKQKPPRPVSVAPGPRPPPPKKQPTPVSKELQPTEEQLQAGGITEAGHTLQEQEPSEGITEAGPTSQPTEGITEAGPTSQPTEGIAEAGPTLQPTEGITAN